MLTAGFNRMQGFDAHLVYIEVLFALQETMACTDDESGQSSDEDEHRSSCDLSGLRVEELSQTARHVSRQVMHDYPCSLLGCHQIMSHKRNMQNCCFVTGFTPLGVCREQMLPEARDRDLRG